MKSFTEKGCSMREYSFTYDATSKSQLLAHLDFIAHKGLAEAGQRVAGGAAGQHIGGDSAASVTGMMPLKLPVALSSALTPRKSSPSLVSVPVLSKQKTRILPEMAMRLAFSEKMPFLCEAADGTIFAGQGATEIKCNAFLWHQLRASCQSYAKVQFSSSLLQGVS